MRKEAVFVATQLTEAVSTNQRIDDSEFENFNGQLVRRPAPKEEHADYHFYWLIC